jgi:hypothetical protein
MGGKCHRPGTAVDVLILGRYRGVEKNDDL